MGDISKIVLPGSTTQYDIKDATARNGLVGKADADHVHDASDVTTGTFLSARLPAATTTNKGAIIEAPNDGVLYGRKRGNWTQIPNVDYYITDMGTDSGWTYKKYSNGTYEAVKRLTITSMPSSYSYGVLYRTAGIRFGDLPSFDSGNGFDISPSYMPITTSSVMTASGWPVCLFAPGQSSNPCETGVWCICSYASANSINGQATAVIRGTYT
jgi:hypothetical protein